MCEFFLAPGIATVFEYSNSAFTGYPNTTRSGSELKKSRRFDLETNPVSTNSRGCRLRGLDEIIEIQGVQTMLHLLFLV